MNTDNTKRKIFDDLEVIPDVVPGGVDSPLLQLHQLILHLNSHKCCNLIYGGSFGNNQQH